MNHAALIQFRRARMSKNLVYGGNGVISDSSREEDCPLLDCGFLWTYGKFEDREMHRMHVTCEEI